MEKLSALSTGKKVALTVGIAIAIAALIAVMYYMSAPGTQYLGCYTDKPERAMTLVGTEAGGYTLASCRDAAKAIGAKVFGLQYGSAETGLGQCFTSNSADAAKKYGAATNCTPMPSGNEIVANASMGGSWSNAVYLV